MWRVGRQLLALALTASSAASAQTAVGCDPSQSPPGTSNSGDVSRAFCSLTRRPLPIETMMPSTLQHWMGYADVSAMLVVTSYGAVDSRLTRPWSYGGGGFGVRGYNMNDSMMVALAKFRFMPGFAFDTAVRAALGIHLITRGAPDSVPATSSWRYIVGSRGGDTLILDWTPAPPLPLGAPADIGAAVAAAVAELRVTRLYAPYWLGDATLWTGCSAIGKQVPDSAAVAAWLRMKGVPLANEGSCESFERRHAVEWTRIFRITTTAYTIRYVAPGGQGGKCRVERGDGGWMGLCG